MAPILHYFSVCPDVAEPNTRLHVIAVIFVIKTIYHFRESPLHIPTGYKKLPYKSPQNTWSVEKRSATSGQNGKKMKYRDWCTGSRQNARPPYEYRCLKTCCSTATWSSSIPPNTWTYLQSQTELRFKSADSNADRNQTNRIHSRMQNSQFQCWTESRKPILAYFGQHLVYATG